MGVLGGDGGGLSNATSGLVGATGGLGVTISGPGEITVGLGGATGGLDDGTGVLGDGSGVLGGVVRPTIEITSWPRSRPYVTGEDSLGVWLQAESSAISDI